MSKFLFYSSLLFSLFALQSFSYAAYDDGDGSPEFPYEIVEPNQLIYMSQHPEHWSQHFILTSDINLALADPNTFSTALIAPDGSNAFTGVFNGNSHTISNLIIDTAGADNYYLGLFGQIVDSSTKIKNLGLENIIVNGGYGSWYLGGLCGLNNGNIINCYTNGSVTGGYLSRMLGGLCGRNTRGRINNCYSTVSVSGGDNSWCLGGIVGSNSQSSISNCYFAGSVTGGDYLGGLCGDNKLGNISICYSNGSVTSGAGFNYLGGLCGRNAYGCISNCYFLDTAGSDNGYGTPLDDPNMRMQSSFVGWDFIGETTNGTSATWIIHTDHYPSLYHFDPTFVPHVFVGQGTAQNPYLICDPNDLGSIYQQPDCHYRLENDLELVGISWSISVIPFFSGVFDGGGHTISNLNISGGSCLGLIGASSSNAIILSLGLENVNVTGGDNSRYLGELCGWNEGIIYNCYITGSVTGGFEANSLGGLCGWNQFGSINNCFAAGTITGGENSEYIGNLCGANIGDINNCYSTGYVTGGTGSRFLGGLCGYSNDSINNCYFLNTAGPDNGFGIPLDDPNMKMQSNFVGWDFVGESANGTSSWWTINAGEYPSLYYFDPAFVPHAFVGHGTAQDPYLIYDPNDLGAIWQQPNCHYRFQNDLDLTGINWSIAVIPYFTGVFDGYGYIISNLNISGGSHLGLMGISSSNVIIRNLDLENVCITGGVGDKSFYLGGLCGRNERNSIFNCYASGSITGDGYLGGLCGYNYYGNISNCYSSFTLIGGANSGGLGGLCGHNVGGRISNCYAHGSVTGGGNPGCLGGLCGFNQFGNIENCYTTSSIIGQSFLGGLCGTNFYGSIRDCCATSSVISIENSFCLGGICGENAGDIINCYSTGSVTGGDGSWYLGSLCGENYYGEIINCYSTGAVTGGDYSRYLGGLCGHNDYAGTISNCYANGSVTSGNNSSRLGGLCGRNYEGIITNCYATGAVEGRYGSDYLGGLCGGNWGTISNCYTIGSVTGDDYLGGLCGRNYYTISNCYATGAVEGGDGSYYLGGLVGYNNEASVSNCFAIGRVSGNDYLGGLVGYDYESEGSFDKCFWNKTINSTLDGISNNEDPNIIGETTDNLQKYNTFVSVNWDFVGEEDNGTEDYWQMCIDGYDYPRLAWQFSNPADFLHPGRVDNYDLFVFTHDWLSINSRCCDIAPADNGDDFVNLLDYAEFTKYWLIE